MLESPLNLDKRAAVTIMGLVQLIRSARTFTTTSSKRDKGYPELRMMGPRLRHYVLRHYTWFVVVALVALLAYMLLDGSQTDWAATATAIGVVLSTVYFVQKQKLEELRLLDELFRDFNSRYDRMNERLNALCASDAASLSLPGADRDKLNDYFNLCGEEFLYFSLGYVPPQVWRAWFNGMMVFRKNKWIREVWDEELKSDSYYGLRFES